MEAWRSWGLFGAGTYSRGEGEGFWRSDQHRFIIALTPAPLTLLQIDNDRPRTVGGPAGLQACYPAGHAIRTVADDSRFAQVCWSPRLYEAIAPDLPGPPRLDPAVNIADPLLAQLARSLAEETGRDIMDRLLADSLMAALAMRIARHARVSVPITAPDLSRQRLQRVLDYIEAHLDDDLTLGELASVACFSPCHFSRSFKSAMGVGPQRYLVQRRVERAKELISRTCHPLATIAQAVGFADQSHFTNTFRRETGITPARFRLAALA